MIAQDYMHKYHMTREQLAQVAVKNHYNGARNPIAQFQSEITLDTVLKSTMVAEPLRLFDCSPVTDGAAAVIVAPLDRAREFTDTPIKVLATAQASDSIALHDRRDISTLDATVAAGQRAFKMAQLTHADIDMVEVHDCFSIAEICAIEDLGFCRKGTAGKFTADGETALGGKIPVNTSGGLKSCGHPVGATGIKQVCEIVQQLRGTAGKCQIENAKIGMTHNVGGTGRRLRSTSLGGSDHDGSTILEKHAPAVQHGGNEMREMRQALLPATNLLPRLPQGRKIVDHKFSGKGTVVTSHAIQTAPDQFASPGRMFLPSSNSMKAPR